ncbi:hypothetical protein RHGRI_016072 [Rhododendron griersonianum]|uniref:Jacalin-type lectin domain-containing protein n=1 Tax=Rhododendron griersonianum TaxID=479676 RepID=A0AAV6JS73_9ERIC|nr:hypothetical protein RHGRI_016072 [Rhododendron griersonianum]
MKSEICRGKVSSTEGWISIGPWGGRQGEGWAYKPTEGFIIKQIIVRHGGAVDSLLFQSETSDGSLEYSERFGGPGGTRTDKVCIDSPAEYITAINIRIGNSILFGNFSGQVVITSLSFVTNVSEYGPFGSKLGTFISTLVENGCMVGFHGRAGEFINSIGFYASEIPMHMSNPSPRICLPGAPVFLFYCKYLNSCSNTLAKQDINAVDLLSLRDPGPWGGPGGNQWDDGVFAAVQKVHLYIGHGWIHAIQVEYMKRDGKNIWSPMHGTPSGELIEMDCAGEVLVGIEGHCGPVEGGNGIGVAITSISLYTNRGKYGPFGGGNSNERGRSYFISGLSGKVVGFFGRSGTYLNAIGVHIEYP